jgi:ribonucleoside-diphosphate reductase alpha chain
MGEEFRVYTHHATGKSGGSGVAASTPIAVMRNGVKPIVRLTFSNGQDVRCTANHRFWTLNRGYVAAGELSEDDQVMLNDAPTPAEDASWALPAAVQAKAKSFSRGGSVTYQELPDGWSEGLGELTGHLVGDGWMTDVQTGWVYGGDDIEDGLMQSHEGLLEELIGGISEQEMQNGTVQLRAGSEAVREFFSNLGVNTSKAPDKRVPWAIFGAPTEVQSAFLRGLFGADGCVSWSDTNRYVGLGSRSEALLKDVQRVLSAFGVRSQIYHVAKAAKTSFSYRRVDGTSAEYAAQDGYDLRVTGSDMQRFADQIGFSTPRKQKVLESLLTKFGGYSTKRWARLASRDDDGQEHVYNLTEPVNHSYMVNGFLVANCSEYMHVDDSACNLASINLLKFLREDGSFDTAAFEHTVDVVFLAQEILVGFSSYPTDEITANAKAMRQLGLGYANLGALLMAKGLPYDSDEGRSVAAAITALMTGRAYRTSGEVAAAVGPYEEFAKNREPHLRVMRKHRDAAHQLDEAADGDLLAAARRSWDEAVTLGELHGHRNAQATVLAPTGTISFLMDCDTTGIEPDFSLVKLKELVGGGHMTIVNRTVPRALRTLGYSEPEIEQVESYINDHRTIVGAPGLKDEHLPVFDVAVGQRAISHMGHIKMMSAVQPFISGAISKTVNMPADSTVADIREAYVEGGRLGLKALAIYRDGSKTAQALRTDAGSKQKKAAKDEAMEAAPSRNRLPRERESLTHKFSIAGHEGYITAGKYEDGSLGEIFLTDIGKDGSTLRGMMNAFATAISIGLQYGVPLETFVRKFSYMRFDPEGMTTNPEIPFAKSLPDYIMRWLASRFLDPAVHEELGIMSAEVRAKRMAEESSGGGNGGNGHANGHTEEDADAGSDGEAQAPTAALTDSPPVVPARIEGLDLGPACSQCGGMMQRTGSCYTCSSCGNNTGCG